jgi:hypothetical protein
MRKRNVIVLGALVLAVTAGLAAVAQATVESSTVTGTTTPSKLQNAGHQAATLNVAVDTGYDDTCANAGTCSPYATNTTVHFDNDFQFTTSGLPTCSPQEPSLAGPPEQSKAGPCKRAVVGSGSAVLAGAVGPQTATVVAFNGTKSGGHARLILSSWVAALNTPAILIGTLTKIHSGDYGWSLDVNVPQIAGGSEVITHFETAVHRAYTVRVKKHGKFRRVKRNFIGASCHDRNHKLDYQETTTYSDASTLSDASQQACTVRHTGQRARALRKCKHKHGGARKRCIRSARRLPV